MSCQWVVDHWREGLKREKRWARERRMANPFVLLSRPVQIAKVGRERDLVVRHVASEALWIQKLPE